MAITPSDIFDLALSRHREPWNWTLHFAGLAGFTLTLLLHSYLMFAVSLIIFGAGFFQLNLPPLPENRWLRFVHSAVEWEKNWVAAPWNWHKTWRFGFVLLITYITIWALWTRDAVVLALLIGFGYLIKVVLENLEYDIRP